MIVKSYELQKIDLEKNLFVLLYGTNEGSKNQATNIILGKKKITSIYEEKEILLNSNLFLEDMCSGSLFEEEKVLIIRRASDRLLEILIEIIDKNLEKITIIINCDNLEKKSKLRSLFEKRKDLICIPFYPDTDQVLAKIANNFFFQKKISISSSDINMIISKCGGDRKLLHFELEKLENYSKNGKKITTEIISKLTNLTENHDITELIDLCLANEKKRTLKILTENTFSNEDSILILKLFLNKLKKILELSNKFEENKDINLTISLAKPPIFWKKKEITKKQILNLESIRIKKMIYELYDLELKIKKNFEISLKLMTDFIMNQFQIKINN